MWVIRCRFTPVFRRFANVRGQKVQQYRMVGADEIARGRRVGCTFVPEPRMVRRIGQIRFRLRLRLSVRLSRTWVSLANSEPQPEPQPSW